MFKFENDVLTECRGLAGNETDYDPIAEAKDIAEDASINSFDVGSSIDFGEDGSLTITSHDIGYDPDVKMATGENAGTRTKAADYNFLNALYSSRIS